MGKRRGTRLAGIGIARAVFCLVCSIGVIGAAPLWRFVLGLGIGFL